MEFFKDKINRARLLDLTVVNTLHEKSKFYDLFKQFFKNEEEFNNFFKNGYTDDAIIKSINYIARNINTKNQGNMIGNYEAFLSFNNFNNFNENNKIIKNNKVYINFDDLSEYFRNKYKEPSNEELLQRIGDEGENAAYEYLIGEYKKKGFIQDSKNDNNVKLTKKNSDDFVQIILCNTFSSKQSGYDIKIIINENGRTITKYVEVKTHTINSINSGTINLSYQQYCMSILHKDYYSVIVMKALFSGDKINCELNKKFDPFYIYECKEVRPEHRDYLFEFDE